MLSLFIMSTRIILECAPPILSPASPVYKSNDTFSMLFPDCLCCQYDNKSSRKTAQPLPIDEVKFGNFKTLPLPGSEIILAFSRPLYWVYQLPFPGIVPSLLLLRSPIV